MGLFSHFIANIVKGEWRIKQVYSFFIPSRILFSQFTANIVKGEWRIKQVYSFIIPSHILYSQFTANITTNAQMLCKRMGKNLFLHAMSAAKLR